MNPGIHLSGMIKSRWRWILNFWQRVTLQAAGWGSFFVYFYLNTELSKVLPAVMRSLWINSYLSNGRLHRAFFIFSAVDVHESLPGKMGLVSFPKRTLTLHAQTLRTVLFPFPWDSLAALTNNSLQSPVRVAALDCAIRHRELLRGHTIIAIDEKSLSRQFCCSQVKEALQIHHQPFTINLVMDGIP